MNTFLIIAVLVLWTTSCVATRYLILIPFEWRATSVLTDIFWFFMWPLALVVSVCDFHHRHQDVLRLRNAATRLPKQRLLTKEELESKRPQLQETYDRIKKERKERGSQ